MPPHHQGDPVLGGQALDEGDRVIRRRVIAQHQLARRRNLPQDALDLLADETRPVVRAQDDGDHAAQPRARVRG